MDDTNSTAARDAHLHWSVLAERTHISTPIFSLLERRQRAADGREATYYTLRSPDWGNVLALTEDGRAVMVRQYRHGSEAVSLEFPGGVLEAGESPIDGAAREFREETGWTFDSIEAIGNANPNPAMMMNRVHFFVAHGARPGGAQELDRNEVIDVELVLLDDLYNGARPDFDNALMFVTLAFYDRYRRARGA